mgnify:CR=1 FL=1
MSKTINKEIWINAPVEEVFRRFTVAEAMLEWHGKEVETNPVPGGIYKVVFEDGTTILGEFKEVELNKRLCYSAAYGTVETLIEVQFIPEKGGTLLKLRQDFLGDDDVSPFSAGWDYFLGILVDFLKG